MGYYKEMKKSIREGYKSRSNIYKDRIYQWRTEPTVSKINKPTNIPRARSLGYKAKPGVIMLRVKVVGGKKKRKHFDGGRKPSKSGKFYSRATSTRAIAEGRAARKFINCEVLNSYFVGQAGSETFYEVIMLEKNNSNIIADKNYLPIVSQKGRAFRSTTHVGIKHRYIK